MYAGKNNFSLWKSEINLRFVKEGFETKNRHQDTCAAKSIKYTMVYTILNLACWPFGLNGLEMKIFKLEIIICMIIHVNDEFTYHHRNAFVF